MLPFELTKKWIEILSKRIDYIFTNVIGPPLNEINKNSNVKLKNMNFLITPSDKQIVFNLISCKDKINIICSFNEGIIKDKKRYERCIYKAYKSLLKT